MGTAAVYYTLMSAVLTTVLKEEGHQVKKWWAEYKVLLCKEATKCLEK